VEFDTNIHSQNKQVSKHKVTQTIATIFSYSQNNKFQNIKMTTQLMSLKLGLSCSMCIACIWWSSYVIMCWRFTSYVWCLQTILQLLTHIKQDIANSTT